MATSDVIPGLSNGQAFIKRCFDIGGAVVGLLLTWWLILIAWVVASLDTHSNGFFTQQRVGRYGRLFWLVKIKTMRSDGKTTTTITRRGDPRITSLGAFFRRTKIDELPQLWNILVGDMSFVGPRPDVSGFADTLDGEDRAVLALRPGMTGPATIKYRNEEMLLAKVDDPDVYNCEVIWPDKVKMNLNYIRNWSLGQDLKYILQTIF